MTDRLDLTLPPPPAATSATCPTCGERAPLPGRRRCGECIAAEWDALAAADPAWYEKHRIYRP